MIKIEGTNEIHLTRGDAPTTEFNRLAVCLPILNVETGEEELYKFKLTDKLTFKVFEKKGYLKEELFRIDWTLEDLNYPEEQESVEIPLTEDLTKLFEETSKKKTYWYDICLNDTTTILGFDEDGAKKLIVYPEGGGADE